MESLFLGEALGSDPIPSCSAWKSVFNEFKFCSSDKALCLTQEKLEYRYLKDNCKFETSVEKLISKYPWSSYNALSYRSFILHKLHGEMGQLKPLLKN